MDARTLVIPLWTRANKVLKANITSQTLHRCKVCLFWAEPTSSSAMALHPFKPSSKQQQFFKEMFHMKFLKTIRTQRFTVPGE
jgi:hypothetical protein